jgi:hypothetical protein
MNKATMNLESGWRAMMAEHKASCSRPHPVMGLKSEELERFRQLFARISYRKHWTVQLLDDRGMGRIQIATIVPDSTTGKPMENYSGPVILCPEMSDGFLIDLAFELLKEFEMHEAAERFSVGGERVYFPHDAAGIPLTQVPSMRVVPPAPVKQSTDKP